MHSVTITSSAGHMGAYRFLYFSWKHLRAALICIKAKTFPKKEYRSKDVPSIEGWSEGGRWCLLGHGQEVSPVVTEKMLM